jgi:hypothetical protein
MSVTHFWFGFSAVKSRSSALGAACFVGSLLVVVGVDAFAAGELHVRHRPGDHVAAGRLQVVATGQLAGNLSAAVNGLRLGMNRTHGGVHALSPLGRRARLAAKRVVVPRLRDVERFTQEDDRIQVAMLRDPGVLHSDSFAPVSLTIRRRGFF